jgi:hypothetical protein
MSFNDCNYLVATVDHLGFRPDAAPADRVRHAQGLWRGVRRILNQSEAEYLHDETDTVIVAFPDYAAARLAAIQIRDGLQDLPSTDTTSGINVSLGSAHGTPDIDRLLGARRLSALSLSFSRRSWLVSDETPVITIGRGRSNEISLHDETSSREHARVEFRGDHYVLTDCSRNGTVLKDVSGERLIVGGEIQLPRAGIICCSGTYFGQAYPESILFGPPDDEA